MRSSTLLSALALSLAASAVGAADNKNMPCSSSVCFYNFYSDMSGSFWIKNETDNELIYMWGFAMDLGWKASSGTKSSNFTLEWLMQDLPGADNSTKVVWSQNVTSNSFAFTPSDDSSFWPTTTTPNMTHFEAVGYGSGRNQFRISETGTLNTSDSMTYDLSRPFMMRQFWHDRTVQWRLEGDDALLDKANKIHTYLVVGMVLSALVAGLAAWLVGRWFERRSLGRIGGQGKARAFEQMR